MSYGKDGYPTELANKVGHIALIEDPMIQSMIESFEDCRRPDLDKFPSKSGSIDLSLKHPIEQVVTVDGGHQAVPNIARPERQVGFAQIAAQLVKLETIRYLDEHRMADPRHVRRLLSQYTHHTLAALPLVGVNIAGLNLQESLREAVHRFMSYYQLYEALAYLVYRKWQKELDELPFMACHDCGAKVELPRGALAFECGSCSHKHRLADYLCLFDEEAEDRSRSESVSSLRAVLEVLVLFSFIVRFRHSTEIMSKTLFLLDGPLLLRAQLSRLVEPIRALLENQKEKGIPIYLAGVEKGGELRAFADVFGPKIPRPGDYFIPATKFLIEEVHGRGFFAATYRNRVSYGAKAITRLSADHVLVLNVPTGEFSMAPVESDLYGFDVICRALSELTSYAFENALMPIVLANSEASISNRPSGGILAQFVDQILSASAPQN